MKYEGLPKYSPGKRLGKVCKGSEHLNEFLNMFWDEGEE